MEKNLLYTPFVHILLILMLSVVAYSNTFYSSFHFDDNRNIVKNQTIRKLEVFIEPSKAMDFSEYSAFKSRYIGYLTFAINYKIHGLNVTGYHIFNISIHIINALLVYWLILLSFKTPYFLGIRPSSRSLSNPPSPPFSKGGMGGFEREEQGKILIALFSALLFAVHPIQTQAVTYIVQRLTSLAAMFYLLSLVMYIRWRFMNQNIEHREKISNLKSVICYLSSVFSAILAMKTKEIAFTLPVIIALYEFMFFEGKIRRRILYLIPLLLTMLIIPLGLMGEDKPIGDLISDMSEAARVSTTTPRPDYLFTEFRVLVTYIRLIFSPVNQNLDYDYPIYHSFFNIEILLSFLFLFLIFSIAIYLLYSSRITPHGLRLTAFGIFWFFITLSIESSVIPIRDVIYEHRMYLPSAGVFIAISAFIFIIIEKLKETRVNIWKAINMAIVVIIVVLTGAAYARNAVWKDELSLWNDVVNKSPQKERAHNNLGNAYMSQNLIDKAFEHFNIAFKLNPYMPEAQFNLGNIYLHKGLSDKAIEYYLNALKLNPYVPEIYYNLGNACMSQNLIDKAIDYYRIALKLNPYIPEAHNNLGNAYFAEGFIDQAISHYHLALQINPDFTGAQRNLENAHRALSATH